MDQFNALFELFGALCAWLNVFELARDKEVKGVNWLSTAFFCTWGGWNLFYYPSLHQPFSAFAAAFLCIANAVWLILLISFRRIHSDG